VAGFQVAFGFKPGAKGVGNLRAGLTFDNGNLKQHGGDQGAVPLHALGDQAADAIELLLLVLGEHHLSLRSQLFLMSQSAPTYRRLRGQTRRV
jgi:hypothetical protein